MVTSDPRTERIKIFIMAVDPRHWNSNEAVRANQDIYDDVKWKKHFWSLGLFQCFNPLTVKLFNLNFHPLEVVSR